MKFLTYDIETLLECFHISIYVHNEDKWDNFTISKYENELDAFIKFTETYGDYYWVSYNGLRFDSQVIQWISEKYHDWYNYTNLEICKLISDKAQDVIDDANYDIFPNYRENELTLKQVDLIKIHHFDNKNRRVSLKRLEFEMDFENIEEMPIHHLRRDLTEDEITIIKDYCKNDVGATYKFFLFTIGETDHPLYKGNDQIQLRLDIETEFSIPCMNYSDSKIGDEIIKKYYCEEKRIEYQNLPKKGLFRKEIKVKHCIADYVTFQTKELQSFLKQIRRKTLTIRDDFKESIEFYGNTYSFMKGGLHSENKPHIFEEDEDHLIIDWDVSSYYPAIIINNGRYPYHLGPEFLIGYEKMFNKRLDLKPQAKIDKRIAGIVGALKLAVNSVYGKSSDMLSWMYDRQLTMFTTITGELSLVMLIEAYELAGIKVISANTDGVTIRIKKTLLNKMNEINKWWCDITSYQLERADYKKIIFSTVNDYLAIKTDGELKKKGDFLTDFELYKNKSAKIIPMALERYFVENIPAVHTITNHDNIMDFCIRQKASKDFHYEGKSENNTTIYNKLIRYYVSNTGEKILKIKNPECTTNAVEVAQVEAGEWVCTVCNYLPKSTKVKDCNINYDYYIEKANRIINKIKLEGRKAVKEQPKNQLALW